MALMLAAGASGVPAASAGGLSPTIVEEIRRAASDSFAVADVVLSRIPDSRAVTLADHARRAHRIAEAVRARGASALLDEIPVSDLSREADAEAARLMSGWRIPSDVHAIVEPVVRAFVAVRIETVRAFTVGRPSLESLGVIQAAQRRLLEAAQRLSRALRRQPLAVVPEIVDVPGVVHVDLGVGDDIYEEDYALLIDGGGNDRYLNNAGGSGGTGVIVQGIEVCAVPQLVGVGALIDLSGDDIYGQGESCGRNGGAVQGSGFLYDAEGDDSYLAGSHGTNGGSDAGSGWLFDEDGRDQYLGSNVGTNGGTLFGLAVLIDRGDGDDSYTAGSVGTNGAAFVGRSLFADEGGHDRYEGTEHTNGSTHTGSATFVDASGDDTYWAADGYANGSSANGDATLIDLGGNDKYLACQAPLDDFCFLTNAGAFGRHAVLYDAEGDDEYVTAGKYGNGSGTGGLLLDESGNDHYRCGDYGCNGGGVLGIGLLVDLDGDDRYEGGDYGVNGSGFVAGFGGLVDLAGDDIYVAGDYANGGASFRANGLLVDLDGDDQYIAGYWGANGRAEGGTGLLYDGAGHDSYVDEWATTVDCSRIPFGIVGALIDGTSDLCPGTFIP